MKKLEELITTYKDFPKKGINFKDVLEIIQEPKVFNELILKMSSSQILKKSEAIISIDARGFIFGSAIALQSSKPMIVARKPGKLPGETITEKYKLEYGENSLSIQKNSLKKRVDEQIRTRKKIISDFLKDLSLREKQITTSKKTGINENTITRMKNNNDFVTSFDNAIALYSVYPELNKMFLNQWIEVSGMQSVNEYEVQVNGSITKNFDLLPLLPNDISLIKIPQNIFINFKI